jgi:hypothetical protein
MNAPSSAGLICSSAPQKRQETSTKPHRRTSLARLRFSNIAAAHWNTSLSVIGSSSVIAGTAKRL